MLGDFSFEGFSLSLVLQMPFFLPFFASFFPVFYCILSGAGVEVVMNSFNSSKNESVPFLSESEFDSKMVLSQMFFS